MAGTTLNLLEPSVRRAAAQAGAASPEPSSPPRHLVVLCHGAAASAVQMRCVQRIWREHLPGAAFLRPNAPLTFERPWIRRLVLWSLGRRAWFCLQESGQEAVAKGVRAAAARLDRQIDRELKRLNLSGRDLVLAGFSQGGMLALFAGMRRVDPPCAVVCMAGALLDPPSLPADRRPGPAVLLMHGEADQMVPAALSHDGESLLRGRGLRVSAFYEPAAGHRLTPAMIAHAGRFVAETTAAASVTALHAVSA